MLQFFGVLVEPGLRRCMQVFSSCGTLGLLFAAVHKFLIAVASRCRVETVGFAGFSSCSTGAWLLCGM